VFEEPTADRLIESVAPNVYVKGGDYHATEIAEFDLLKRLGIEIDILAHRPGLGSTAIIDRLRAP
jgi:D-beta-D-heptose 7-phosphate kinase/D-beta-D-heptose 1-phosphate adenosyltransferase